MRIKILCALVAHISSLMGMELPSTTSCATPIDLAAATKALYVCHKLLPSLRDAAVEMHRIATIGITPKEAVSGIRDLQKGPFLTAIRFKYPGILEKVISTSLTGRKKIDPILAKSTSPEAIIFKEYVDVLGASSRLFELRKEILNYATAYEWLSFEPLDTRFAEISSLMRRAVTSNNAIIYGYVNAIVKKHEGTRTLAESAWDIFVDSHEHLSALFDPAQLNTLIEFIESDDYQKLYARLHEKITNVCCQDRTKNAKKILRILLHNGETITLPKVLDGDVTSWKKLLEEVKKTATVHSVEKKQLASDESFVRHETTEYVVIEDPRNDMRITLYKTREPESEKAPEIGYHHRVSDLSMMDRAELVRKIATEKKISPLIAHEAVRQKTPALIADQYLHYAHDNFFIDKSGNNIPNKTLLCRIERAHKSAQEYFLIWGFLEDGSCYHRGLSFNGSLDESIKKLAEKTRYDFDFPALEKLEKAAQS